MIHTLFLHTRHTLFIPSYRYAYEGIRQTFGKVKRIPAIVPKTGKIFVAVRWGLSHLFCFAKQLSQSCWGKPHPNLSRTFWPRSGDETPSIRALPTNHASVCGAHPATTTSTPFGYYRFFFALGTCGTFFSGSHLASSSLTAAYFGLSARLFHSSGSFSWS